MRNEISEENLKNLRFYYHRYCARRDPRDDAYGLVAVIQQMKWITNPNETVTEKDGPLIFYDNRYLWHTLSPHGCQYYCRFSTNFSDYRKAVLAVFTQDPPPAALPKPVNQTWALETGEPPFKMPQISPKMRNHFRIFLTTNSESHVPWVYGVFMANKEPEKIVPLTEQIQMLNENNARWLPSHHAQRRKKAVALVSNRRPKNRRMDYMKELANYTEVDFYGRGQRNCSRKGDECLRGLSRQYKFYLAFENSNCKDYITEKLFRNALQFGMLPVVMGASRDEYCAIAPPNSFIHVDDFASPAALAKYLNWLDRNDTAYASYFAWKAYGKIVRYRRTDCRLC
ncbi:hypothetical protein AAHC03_019044 [Spirometra sp. Aus1]